MPEYSPMAEERRPTVRIQVFEPNQNHMRFVLDGLEEEGIPAEISPAAAASAATLGKEAAQMSPLNVGIGVNGAEGLIVLHHRDLPLEQPLFTFHTRNVTATQLRLLGANAARLVKGEPLIFQDEHETGNPSDSPAERSLQDSKQVADLVTRAVLELLAQR